MNNEKGRFAAALLLAGAITIAPQAWAADEASMRDFVNDPARLGSLAGSTIVGALAAHPAGVLVGSIAGYFVGQAMEDKNETDPNNLLSPDQMAAAVATSSAPSRARSCSSRSSGAQPTNTTVASSSLSGFSLQMVDTSKSSADTQTAKHPEFWNPRCFYYAD